jgi:queuine tRNA-ribosyltransferase
MGTQILLGNTYHLSIRPGMDIIRKAGGLHRFMNWSGPILTDSGGFQVFSLGKIRKIRDHGVEFRSHLDGSPIFLGPKESMEIQRTLGSDIAMVFDECPPHTADRDEVNRAVKRTLRWAAECKAQPRAEGQLVFGIVQGTHHADLRKKCAEALVEMDFDGYAIGGLSVGESLAEMVDAIGACIGELPKDQPRYLMGVGDPASLVEAVALGVDQFDCVLQTRVGRHGTALTSGGKVHMKNAQHTMSEEPLDALCHCWVCKTHTRGYLRHLTQVGEPSAARLLSIHNVAWTIQLMNSMKQAIEAGTFGEFRRQTLEVWG